MNHRLDPTSRDDPLTPEERAWAQRLAQLGPHDGPSTALDAKVLGAAQAAVATPATRALTSSSGRRSPRRYRQRRWPMLVGAAASLVIVVGLAWQLQPLLRTRPSAGEGPVAAASLPRSESPLSAEVLAAADPVARRAGLPPVLPARAATSAPGTVDRSPPRSPRAPAPASPPLPRARATVPPRAAPDFGDDAIPPYRNYAGTSAARQSAATASSADALGSRGTSGTRQADASPQAFPAQQQDHSINAQAKASTPVPPAPAPDAMRADARRRQALARDSSGLTSAGASADAADAARDRPPSRRDNAVDPPTPLARQRVEADAHLLPAAWLQRIRDRRDAGDPDRALESLALFRTTHPHIPVPDDLARLPR